MTKRRYKIGDWHPKEHHFSGLTLEWGKDLTQEQVSLLEYGETFILLDKEGNLFKRVLMDSYGAIREGDLVSHKREKDRT